MFSKGCTVDGKSIAPFDMPLLGGAAKEAKTLSLSSGIDRIEREAYEKGFAAGEKAGFDMGEQKALVLIEKLELLLSELTSIRQNIVRELEPSIVELSVSIARKILIKELSADPDHVVAMTREAVMKIERTGQIMIKINPSLYDLFMKHKPDLLNIHPDIAFDIDPSVSKYGSVILGPEEEVVTDVDEQIRNLIKDMGDILAGD